MSDSTTDAIARAYDTVAASYERLVDDHTIESPLDLAVIGHFVGLLPQRTVLDAGCGAGRMMTYLASLDPGLEVSGLDVSEAMVVRARRHHPARKIDQGDIARLPYAESTFGGVMAWYSVIHTAPERLDAVLEELARVLVPGGSALVAFQSGSGHRRTIDNAYGHAVTMTAFLHSTDHVAHLMEKSGLQPAVQLDRAPRRSDKHPQGFVIGTRAIRR